MLRTALKPRWLGLLGVVILIGVAFVQLGRWQLGVAHDKARVEAVKAAGAKPVVDVAAILTPHEPFPADGSGRMVTATGTYAAGQVLVKGRLLHGRTGYWVVAPFTVASTGATFPLVRGWTSAPTPPPVPTGAHTVRAALAPGEAPSADGLPPGILSSVDLSRLVNAWPGDLYNAFGFVQDETPAPPAATTAGLARVPPPLPPSGLQWRNASYALQWWVFAAFALYLWVRMVHQAHREERGQGDDDSSREDRPDGDGSSPVKVAPSPTPKEASLP